MKAETVWTVIATCSMAVTVLSAVLGILYLRNDETTVAVILFAATALLAGCTAIAYLSGRRSAEWNNRAVFVDCFRLKKPGIERSAEDTIIPKGKMPKGRS